MPSVGCVLRHARSGAVRNGVRALAAESVKPTHRFTERVSARDRSPQISRSSAVPLEGELAPHQLRCSASSDPEGVSVTALLKLMPPKPECSSGDGLQPGSHNREGVLRHKRSAGARHCTRSWSGSSRGRGAQRPGEDREDRGICSMHGRVVRTGATAHPRAVRAAMRGQRAACADWTSDSQPSWTALQRLRAAGGTVPRRAFVALWGKRVGVGSNSFSHSLFAP